MSAICLSAKPPVEQSHRLFLCGCCLAQVQVCRSCDRGQRYCSPQCAAQARRQRQREAGQRYQRTERGRQRHAARQHAYRQREQQSYQEQLPQSYQEQLPTTGPEGTTGPRVEGGNGLESSDVEGSRGGTPASPTASVSSRPMARGTCCVCRRSQSEWLRQDFLGHCASPYRRIRKRPS